MRETHRHTVIGERQQPLAASLASPHLVHKAIYRLAPRTISYRRTRLVMQRVGDQPLLASDTMVLPYIQSMSGRRSGIRLGYVTAFLLVSSVLPGLRLAKEEPPGVLEKS